MELARVYPTTIVTKTETRVMLNINFGARPIPPILGFLTELEPLAEVSPFPDFFDRTLSEFFASLAFPFLEVAWPLLELESFLEALLF